MLSSCSVEETDSAADLIKNGGLVAFPTETVYGLGADAFNENAVSRIYSTKGRPADNPLIMHVLGREGFLELIKNPPKYALTLIECFWPGALTFVGYKKDELPAWLGGHPETVNNTIAVRAPSHPVARALLKACGKIIAAPSANKAGRPSPTTAQHVLADFEDINKAGSMFTLLQAEASSIGLESTVVDITSHTPKILRPGFITANQIHEATGLFPKTQETVGETPRSPGMKYKHYAPTGEMTVLSGTCENIAKYISQNMPTVPFGLLINSSLHEMLPQNIKERALIIVTEPTVCGIANKFYTHLRHFDDMKAEVIFAQAVEADDVGLAVMDRMTKAANGRIVRL